MEKLINKFENIVRGYYWFYCSKTPELDGAILFQPEMIPLRSSKPCAEETKKLAIEFAKKLMETKITALMGMNDESEIRNSPDYALMKGELMFNGDKLFEQFIEEYYV